MVTMVSSERPKDNWTPEQVLQFLCQTLLIGDRPAWVLAAQRLNRSQLQQLRDVLTAQLARHRLLNNHLTVRTANIEFRLCWVTKRLEKLLQ